MPRRIIQVSGYYRTLRTFGECGDGALRFFVFPVCYAKIDIERIKSERRPQKEIHHQMERSIGFGPSDYEHPYPSTSRQAEKENSDKKVIETDENEMPENPNPQNFNQSSQENSFQQTQPMQQQDQKQNIQPNQQSQQRTNQFSQPTTQQNQNVDQPNQGNMNQNTNSKVQEVE
ncbi:MAG: hypothetical protein R6U26_04335 [Candidatus Undinarchaeales archaeon]